MMKRDECFRDPGAPRHRRDRGRDLQLGGRLARPRRARAQLFLDRRDGARFVACARACARAAGPAHHLPAGRRQPADEPRQPGHDRGGGAEEPRPFRRARTTPTRPTAAIRSRIPKVDFAAMARSAGYRARARLLRSRQSSSSRPGMSSRRTGRCSRPCTSSRRSRSATITPTLRAGAARGAQGGVATDEGWAMARTCAALRACGAAVPTA